MTSMPASRSARAMIFAPRSCPSRPGLATTTRILRLEDASMALILSRLRRSACGERAHEGVDRHEPHEAPRLVAARDGVEAARRLAGHRPPGHRGRLVLGLDRQHVA